MTARIPPAKDQSQDSLLALLAAGEVVAQGLHPRASNYTFVVVLQGQDGQQAKAVYKPRRGEAPLWDFPDGTLYKREYAAYLLAQALGWDLVPATVIRDGPYGVGVMQQYVEHHPQEHYFTLKDRFLQVFQRMCLFDIVANNADRKAGHCLLGLDGRIWGVDHGLTFHPDPKLRTVIWDFAGQPAPKEVLQALERLQGRLESSDGLVREFRQLLTPPELDAMKRRLEELVKSSCFPHLPPGRRAVPWPPI